jgi:hypothetical protein
MDEITTTADTALALTATLMAGTVAQASGIAMTETATAGFYTGSVPVGTPAGSYTVLVQSLDLVVASGVLHWSGAYETPAPANMTYVKGQAINGNGSADTPWGP